MPKIFLLFLLLIVGTLYSSKEAEIESLLIDMGSRFGTDNVDVLNKLARAYSDTLPSKSIEYGLNALELARQLTYQKGKSDALGNIITTYCKVGLHDKAIKHFLRLLKITERGNDRVKRARYLENIGSLYHDTGKYDEALTYYQKALSILEERDDRPGIAVIMNMMAKTYGRKKKYYDAIAFYNSSIKLALETGDQELHSSALNNLGNIYKNLDYHNKAMIYYKNAHKIFEKNGNVRGLITSLNNYAEYHTLKKGYDTALSYLNRSLSLALKSALPRREKQKKLKTIYKLLHEVYREKGDYKNALGYFNRFVVIKDAIINDEKAISTAKIESIFEIEKRDRENELLLKNNKIQGLNLEKKELQQNFLFGGITVVVMLLCILYVLYLLKIKVNRKVRAEREKADNLLLNILPRRVAEELKEKGRSEPRTFENVTILFTDFSGFTEMTSTLEPQYVIAELNDIFTNFDQIINRNGCERIKTIGDAYLAVSGMPREDSDHAENIAEAAIEILAYLKERNKNRELQWKIRIGIHTGQVVGGVVGVTKYIYDVFGDSINVAYRMEEWSEQMKINVSKASYLLLKERYDFIRRENHDVKGKGDMEMFFLCG